MLHISPIKGRFDICRTHDRATATALAEIYVLASKPDWHMLDAAAAWRALPMADTQRQRLAQLGIEASQDATAGEASDSFQLTVALRALESATENPS